MWSRFNIESPATDILFLKIFIELSKTAISRPEKLLLSANSFAALLYPDLELHKFKLFKVSKLNELKPIALIKLSLK